jgi:hypothetical protein
MIDMEGGDGNDNKNYPYIQEKNKAENMINLEEEFEKY